MVLGVARAVASSSASVGAPSGITVGTTGVLTHQTADQGSYTYTTGLTVDGGGAKLLLIAVWTVSNGEEENDMSGALQAFTLNGASYSTLLASYMQNTSNNRYVQAALAIWNSPAAGNVIFTPPSVVTTMNGGSMYFMNLTGVHSTPLGTLVRDQFTVNVTALPYQIVTQHANSLLVSVLGCRLAAKGPFTFDGASMTSLGRSNGAAGADGDFDIAYRNGLAAGTYDAGGDSTAIDTSRFAGMAVELRSA